MTIRLPDRVAYRDALHAPAIAFPEPPLHNGTPDLDPRQQPVAASGAFAITFTMVTANGRYAVRCFTQARPQMAERYSAVTDFVRASRSEYLVPVTYQPTGIRISGVAWPIVVMPWVRGSCLNDWVDDNLHHPHKIESVRQRVKAATSALAAMNAAHGDLQHGNILVLPDGTIKLIDYDGMYLPGLTHLGAAERGHRNYQHPDRAAQYDTTLDHFSAAVIDLSLAAVINDRSLWNDFNHGDNLLFTATDFADPDSSKIFQRVQDIPTLAAQARRLSLACKSRFAQIVDALAGRIVETHLPPRTPIATPIRVIAATNRSELLQRDGEEVTVVGRVQAVKTIAGSHGGSYSFVSFGNHWQGSFTIVLWNKVRTAVVRNLGQDVSELQGIYVSVTGRLSQYKDKRRSDPNPQIELRHARALTVLTAAQVAVVLPPTPTKTTPEPDKLAQRIPAAQNHTPVTQRYASVFGPATTAKRPPTRSTPVTATPPPKPTKPQRQTTGSSHQHVQSPTPTQQQTPSHSHGHAQSPSPWNYHLTSSQKPTWPSSNLQQPSSNFVLADSWWTYLTALSLGGPIASLLILCIYGSLGSGADRSGVARIILGTIILLSTLIGIVSSLTALLATPVNPTLKRRANYISSLLITIPILYFYVTVFRQHK